MPEVEQHVKSAFGGSQGLEGVIYEMLCLVLNGYNLFSKPAYHVVPAARVTYAERIERNLKIDYS